MQIVLRTKKLQFQTKRHKNTRLKKQEKICTFQQNKGTLNNNIIRIEIIVSWKITYLDIELRS